MRTELDIWCVLICPRGSKAPEAACELPGRDECKGELVADLLKVSLLRGSKGWLETGLGRPDVEKDPPRAGEWGTLEGWMNIDLVPSTNRPPSGGSVAEELGFGASEVEVFEEDEGPAKGGCGGRGCRATGAVKGEGCEGAKG